jgi:hypothetical protein
MTTEAREAGRVGAAAAPRSKPRMWGWTFR